MAYPRRINRSDELDYETLYEFYRELRRRERSPELKSIVLALGVSCLLGLFAWAASTNHLNADTMSTPYEAVSHW